MVTGLDQDRVVEIWVPDTKKHGTGYLITNGCLLTAYHVVKGSSGNCFKCRLLGQYRSNSQEKFCAELLYTFATEKKPKVP